MRLFLELLLIPTMSARHNHPNALTVSQVDGSRHVKADRDLILTSATTWGVFPSTGPSSPQSLTLELRSHRRLHVYDWWYLFDNEDRTYFTVPDSTNTSLTLVFPVSDFTGRRLLPTTHSVSVQAQVPDDTDITNMIGVTYAITAATETPAGAFANGESLGFIYGTVGTVVVVAVIAAVAAVIWCCVTKRAPTGVGLDSVGSLMDGHGRKPGGYA
jgi:hypothetical protein